MKAIQISAFGDSDVLTIATFSDLIPAVGKVRIAIKAISVGYQDIMSRNGSLAKFGIRPGHIPGGEIAGTVDAVGEGVDPAWLGRAVWAFTGLGGGYASQAVVPVAEVVPIPKGLSLIQSVTLGTAGVVAHFALNHAHLEAGESVLVRGAGGPLGIMAVQLAASRQASVIAVTASSRQRGERLRGLGATQVLDRAGATVDGHVSSFDVIIDVVAGPDAAAFMKKLKPGGRMVMIGAVAGPPTDLSDTMFANFQQSLSFTTFSGNLIHPEVRRQRTAELFSQASHAELQMIVADTMPLEQAAEAHKMLEAGGVFGRIILTT